MTYLERYAPYDDSALGIHYLDRYKAWLKGERSGLEGYGTSNFGTFPAADLLFKTNVAASSMARDSFPDWRKHMDDCRLRSSETEGKRTALVLRVYENYTWSMDDVLNVRALISELSLKNSEPLDVRLLLEVHTRELAFLSSKRQKEDLLSRSVPCEFWELTELWNESQMETLYPGLPGRFLNRMSACSSYRSCFMPLQKFALDHPEYAYIWNWEMDTRFTGDYGDLMKGSAGESLPGEEET